MGARRWPCLLALFAGFHCSGGDGDTNSIIDETFAFELDVAEAGSEAYLCFGFDASTLTDRFIRSVRWTPPARGPVALHHASLFALATDFAAGPVPCETMPSAKALHVWAPGSGSLTFPSIAALEPPRDTKRLVVQAHVLKTGDGPPARGSFTLQLTASPPENIAGWLGAVVPVPAIPPRQGQMSTAACTIAGTVHVLSAWPHMHRAGVAFQSAIVRPDGSEQSLVAVPKWSFDEQRTYPTSVDANAGDRIVTTCFWQNGGDSYVLPGLRSDQEMCGIGLVVWPVKSAQWRGSCPE